MLKRTIEIAGKASFALLVAGLIAGLPAASCLMAVDVDRPTAIALGGLLTVAVTGRFL